MVKGGTNFRKQAGERRKKRKGPMSRVSGDIEMISETDVDLSNTTVVDDGEIPGPSNAGKPASEKKLSGTTEKITNSINVDIETLENPTGYRIIDMDILTDLFSVVCCPDCGAYLKLLETKKQGISFHLQCWGEIIERSV